MPRQKSATAAESKGVGNAIGKVCAVLRTLSSNAPLRLNAIADTTGLNRVTTLRILDELTAQGFVARSESPPRYSLGPESVAMGASSSLALDIRGAARASLVRLADFSEDTVLLSVKSNAEAICVDRAHGTYPVQATFLHVGSRRPLGVGAGSMALLAWLPEEERRALLDVTEKQLDAYPRITREVLEEHIRDAHRRGYVYMLDIVVGKIGAIGFPVRNAQGQVVASISIAALTERIVEREHALAEALVTEVESVRKQIAATG